ncbi:hypothetical protein EDD85DRAFT_971313 [Armillaria nabsnona]|nr:hypothetical protein EDD85DRAFT_971313 [Armillaria nabsnona]
MYAHEPIVGWDNAGESITIEKLGVGKGQARPGIGRRDSLTKSRVDGADGEMSEMKRDQSMLKTFGARERERNAVSTTPSSGNFPWLRVQNSPIGAACLQNVQNSILSLPIRENSLSPAQRHKLWRVRKWDRAIHQIEDNGYEYHHQSYLPSQPSSWIVVKPLLVWVAQDRQSLRIGYPWKRAQRKGHLDDICRRAGSLRFCERHPEKARSAVVFHTSISTRSSFKNDNKRERGLQDDGSLGRR